MIAMPCPTPDALRAMSTGLLNDSESSDIVEHIRQCDECRGELEQMDEGDDSLITSLRRPESPSPFDREPNRQAAIAKALGALASSRAPHADPAESAAEGGAADVGPQLPTVIAEYEIVGPLGRGGMGRVFLARHSKLGRRVALKLLADHRLDDPRVRRRFEAEMRAVGRLSHPNIVTAHDARDVDGMAVLITEYIDGVDLGELAGHTGPLGTDRQGIADACEMVRQVAHALAYTSEQGFVHRDVKPSNIMLSSSGEVKLLDLGLARFQATGDESVEMTGTGQTMGTADYMAPEQIGDSRAVDVRADIYSLGCTLFKLLTGFAPFADEAHGTAFAKMTAHVETPPPKLAELLAEIPPDLSRFVDQMLAKIAENRPATPAEISQFLAQFSRGSDLRKLAERVATLTRRPAEKRPPSVSQSDCDATFQSPFRRQVPMIVAIAAGIVGLFSGLVLGIVITVTLPDGSRIAMTVPEGSHVDIQSSGESDQQPAAEETLTSEKLHPLAFAVLSERPLTHDEWSRAKSALEESDGEEPLVTELGVWLPVEDGVEVNRVALHLHNGQRYALVRHDAKGWIGWDEIRPHTGMMYSSRSRTGGTNELRFDFGPDLAPRFGQLTREHTGSRLATIVRGRIVSAPRIMGEFNRQATLTGNFSKDDIEHLRGAFDGLLNDPSVLPESDSGESTPEVSSRGTIGGRLLRLLGEGEQPPAQMVPTTKKHFQQIGIAFHNFHDSYQKFPGSANEREGGRQASPEFPFSWRVAILPFIEQSELFEQYRFNEPWDSPHNLTLLDKMPEVYRSPRADTDTPVGHTHYLGFVGDSTALGPGPGEAIRSFTDGTSFTILIVESGASKPWTAPEDIPFTGLEDAEKLTPFDGQPLHYLTADAAFHSMDPIDYELLGKLITRNGGEKIEP
jgi:serine/threonine protein kinase